MIDNVLPIIHGLTEDLFPSIPKTGSKIVVKNKIDKETSAVLCIPEKVQKSVI